MAEVTIRLANGSTAQLSGSPDEIARVLQLSGFSAGTNDEKRTSSGRRVSRRVARQRQGPREHILELKGAGFFGERRSLGDIQRALEEQGHIYALDSLSPTVVRLVRDRELGRVRGSSGRWTYVDR